MHSRIPFPRNLPSTRKRKAPAAVPGVGQCWHRLISAPDNGVSKQFGVITCRSTFPCPPEFISLDVQYPGGNSLSSGAYWYMPFPVLQFSPVFQLFEHRYVVSGPEAARDARYTFTTEHPLVHFHKDVTIDNLHLDESGAGPRP